MHVYEPNWGSKGYGEPAGIGDDPYTGPLDVVAYASRNCHIGRATNPEVWHLDGQGNWHCGHRDGSFVTVQDWAIEPRRLYAVLWQTPPAACPDHWVVIESRPTWYYDQGVVSEADAQAFVSLRSQLAEGVGLDLVDVMIFDDLFQWWSLHELTTGRASWH